MNAGYVLGLWDGHDAGAALVQGDRVVVAVNEERLSRRKLEVGFPIRSIRACLDCAGIQPPQVADVAASTSDPAKTLTRLVPGLKEEYYLIRRRKKDPGMLDAFKKRFKYRFTEFPPNPVSRFLSRNHLHRQIRAAGFDRCRLHLFDHHLCHAQAAARCSGLDQGLVVTLDGLGDGLCGAIRIYADRGLKMLAPLSASVSLGVFFEHVTHLMNMRELEDEGKVMALANYAYPVPDADNPLMNLVRTKGLSLVSPYGANRLFREMKKIFWRYPAEQFAHMAQRVLEKRVAELIESARVQTGQKNLMLAGGLFSNIKLNMKLAELPGVEHLRVFPHMGDGGLALGAAIAANNGQHGVPLCRLSHLYRGAGHSREAISAEIQKRSVSFSEPQNPAKRAADLILGGEIVLWFQGRSEIGPRALGNRSILARADDLSIKDRLNLVLKKRVWYQPFCPSMLPEDAPALLDIDHQTVDDNRFMTTAFRVRPDGLAHMAGVTNVDKTCRPHFVGDENPLFRELLICIKEKIGFGVVLNTSFNVHGDPMVDSPADALDTLAKTGARYLFMGDFLVENMN